MPNNQRKLRHLFPLLTELHKRRFPTIGIQQLRDPDENLAILLADPTIHHRDTARHRAITIHSPCGPLRRIPAIPGHRNAVVVLLLRGGGGGSGGLDLSMLLGEVVLLGLVRVLLGLVLLLLVLQPGGIGPGVLVLVGEDVLGLRLEHCGRTASGERRAGGRLGLYREESGEDGEQKKGSRVE